MAHGHNPCLRKSGFCFVVDTVVDKRRQTVPTIAVNRQVNKTPASRLPESRQTYPVTCQSVVFQMLIQQNQLILA